MHCVCFFFFKQKTAYEMRISDWSSDVCSSDLADDLVEPFRPLVDALVRRMIVEGIHTVTSEAKQRLARLIGHDLRLGGAVSPLSVATQRLAQSLARSFEERKSALALFDPPDPLDWASLGQPVARSEEHTSELPSLMRISYS